MKLIIPDKRNINITSEDDPLMYYYSTVFKYGYLKRLKIVFSLLKSERTRNLLEIGTGSGIFLPSLANICDNLYSFDIHSNVHMVRDMLVRENIKADLVQADVNNIPFCDNWFDGVVCLSVLEFIENLNMAVNEIHRVTKKEGIVIIGAPVLGKFTSLLYYLCGNKEHKVKHRSSHYDIINAFKKMFYIENIVTFPRVMPLEHSFYFVIKGKKKTQA